MYARATSPTGAYAVRLYSPQGHHVRTISGTLSNGIVKAIWDLADEGGTIYTNDSIRAVFQVTGANSQLLTQTQTLYRAYP